MEEFNPLPGAPFREGIEKEKRREKPEQKVFGKVFDDATLKIIDDLAKKGLFDVLEFAISPGKEAEVFRAVDVSGNYRAVKIYKIKTSGFKKMQDYLKGDYRFKKVGREKHEIVFNWTKKEFRNLLKMSQAKALVPVPLGFKNNVLVMEFIGVNGLASKTLKEESLTKKELESVLGQLVESYARMLFLAGLVHSDFSEFNVLIRRGDEGIKAVVIDCGQAMPKSHPKAREFYERDLKNLANYFQRKGIDVDEEKIRKKLAEWKKKLA